jgi:hypothetical protein
MRSCNVLIVMLGICLIGCGGDAKNQLSREAAPADAAAGAIQTYDKDSDGQISSEELRVAPALAAGAIRIDSNQDGTLSKEELQARFEAYANQSDLIALAVSVAAKRRPLPDATVTLTPEPYMGDGLQSYTGVTTEGGACQLQGTEIPLQGLLPVGFYQAHIVQQELGIDTVVGCEIADDASGSRLQLSL